MKHAERIVQRAELLGFVRWLTRELDFANGLHGDVEQLLKANS